MKVFISTSSPFIKWEDLDIKDTKYLSAVQLAKYKHSTMITNEIELIRRNDCFLAGRREDNKDKAFLIAFELNLSDTLSGGKTLPLHDCLYIRMVGTYKSFEDNGLAREVYTYLAQHYTLVSDRTQYWAAKNLWKSVARSGKARIRIYDLGSSSWLGDYDGKNIDEDVIWGKTREHKDRVLVASKLP